MFTKKFKLIYSEPFLGAEKRAGNFKILTAA